jgi:hypothetical protein
LRSPIYLTRPQASVQPIFVSQEFRADAGGYNNITIRPSAYRPALPPIPQNLFIGQEFRVDAAGYNFIIRSPIYQALILPIQSNVSQTNPTTIWPLIGAGYVQNVRGGSFGAGQASLPLQSATAVTREEWPRDWVGYRQILGPVAYGAVQAAQPLPPSIKTVQEYWWNPNNWLAPPPSPRLRLAQSAQSSIFVSQEYRPDAAGYSYIQILRSGTIQIKIEYPQIRFFWE